MRPRADIDLTGAKVLLVDDTPENLKVLRDTLEREGFAILVATSGEAALRLTGAAQPDLILMDVMMPGMDGFETCERLKRDERTRGIPVIFVTARNETEAVLRGFRAGGVDYVVKPFQSDDVLARVRSHVKIDRLSRQLAEKNAELTRTNNRLADEIAQREALRRERNQLAEHLSAISSREAERWGIEGFIGQSRTIRDTLSAIARVQQTETSVLITGENGTGKELIARAIHHRSGRSGGPFVAVNCTAIPRELAESLLFGHVKGAFTGAGQDRKGTFGLAHGGTLFLDEVGDMPFEIQGKLLRVLEDGRILPVGGTEEVVVDVRVLAATNASLPARVTTGDFRRDLYFRLARYPVTVPPLRERKEDIPLLARHFLRIFGEEMGKETPDLSEEALEALGRYDFPGNVRELKNMMERALIESGGKEVQPAHLHYFHVPGPDAGRGKREETTGADASQALPLNLKEAERVLIRRALELTHGNIAAAARLLGTNRPRIYKFIEEEGDPR